MVPVPPPENHVVRRVRGWKRGVFEIAGRIIHLWVRSLRFEVSAEHERFLRRTDIPVAITLWHNRLFIAGEVVRRFRPNRPVYALISASKDGAWLEAFFEIIGIGTVRGSSSKLGREAAMALIEVLRQGHDIGITPDGPRGPCYEVKPGGLIVTRRVRAPMLLLGGIFDSAWRLRSWDRFYLPKPFSRVKVIGEWVDFSALGDRDESAALLAARLRQINPDHWQPPVSVI